MTTVHSPILRQALADIPDDVRREVNLSYAIADRIAQILADQGMTQKALAQKMGKSEAEVSAWLTGRHNFTLRTLARISSVLNNDLITATLPT